jgi:hypothetical protein
MSKDNLRRALAVIPEREKIELLLRAVDGDAYMGAVLRSRLRKKNPAPAPRRTAGALRMRVQEIREARERADAERVVRRSGAAKRRRPKKHAAPGSRFSSNAAPVSGARSSRRSNAATHLATTRQSTFFAIFRHWL